MENNASSSSSQATNTSSSWNIFDNMISNPYLAFFVKLFVALIIVIILIFISYFISNFIKKKIIKNNVVDNDEYAQKIWNLVWDIIFYCLMIFSIFIWFEIIWFQVWLILWWISLWIWFAFKEILSNMIAWIMILTTKEFKLWDIVEIKRQDTYFGRIEEITIRYTVIRWFDLRRVIIPNLILITYPIKTFNSEEVIRLETTVTLWFDVNLEKAIEIIRATVNSLDFVLEKNSTRVIIDWFGDNWINVRVMFFVDPNVEILYQVLISDVNKAINTACKDNDIVIPYPHTVITVDKNDRNLLGSIMFLMKNKHGWWSVATSQQS